MKRSTETRVHAGPQGGDAGGGWLARLPAAAVLLSEDGSVRAWNVDAAELLGWKPQVKAPRLGTPESPWLVRLLADVDANGSGRALVARRTAGERRSLELRARRTESGALLVLLRDCTAQLASRRTRSEQERRLRRFLERLPEAALIEQDDRIVYANDAAARLLDVPNENLVGVGVGEVVGAGTLRRVQRLLDDIEASVPAEPVELTLHTPGGSLDVQLAALPMQYRRRPAVQLLLRDLTAQRQAEAGLRATHERLRLISETVRDHAIITVDDEHRVASWNAAAERLTGYTAEEIVRAPFALLHNGSADDVTGLFAATRDTGRSERDAQVKRRDGSTFHAQLTVTPLREMDEQLFGYAVIVRDLSERLVAQESLRRSEEQLRHSQKMDAVGRLAAGIAHDFNNILTAIQGHVQFLLEDLPQDLTCRDDATEIKKAADRATELTRQLLTFARKQPTRPALLNVNDVIADLEKLLRRLIRADVELDTAFSQVPHVFADPGQIEQVLVNLVVNARDAITNGGRITISTACIHLDEMYSARGLNLTPGEYVQIAVSDTGMGMSPAMQREIFEPFFTTKAEGTGLGLSTVYGIVKQAGGHVSVYSEEGIGTTFKVFLPAKPVAVPPTPDAEPQQHGCVLLVEDDDAVRSLARRTLVNNGFDVIEATDGAEALRIATDRPGRIDVLVTDLTMPRVSGEELAERIREAQPRAGIVLMSGFSESSLVREGRIGEHQTFLEKPFTPASLARAVRDAMRVSDGHESSTNST